jgi:hypothetical protein
LEKIMSKTNDTSTLDHRPLTDSELEAVSGGTGLGEFIGGIAKDILGPAHPPKPTGAIRWGDIQLK